MDPTSPTTPFSTGTMRCSSRTSSSIATPPSFSVRRRQSLPCTPPPHSPTSSLMPSCPLLQSRPGTKSSTHSPSCRTSMLRFSARLTALTPQRSLPTVWQISTLWPSAKPPCSRQLSRPAGDTHDNYKEGYIQTLPLTLQWPVHSSYLQTMKYCPP